MDTKTTRENYNAIAAWFDEQMRGSHYGVPQLDQAIQFCAGRGLALDVGCGSTARFLQIMFQQGFQAEGLDISEEMLRLTESRRPDAVLHCEDIATWIPEKKYVLITAWDSTFHLPLECQEPVLRKLCAALQIGGVLLFTGGSPRGEIQGEMNGLPFGYSSLGVEGFLEVLLAEKLRILFLQHDQWPEEHVCIIARKRPLGDS